MEDERYMKDIQREYLDFLDDEEDQGIYSTNIKAMVGENSRRLIVNINDLRKKNAARTNLLLQNGFQEQLAFCRALKEYVMSNHPGTGEKQDEYFVGFEGSFGSRHVTPRSLTSKFLGNLVCVEGIVTKLSLVRPKVVRSVHYCPATKKIIERKYADLTSMEAMPTSSAYPKQDEDGNLLETEFGLSVYKDHQTLYIQEMPEKAPPGQLPRSVHVICDDDLVDRVKPGDRIQVVGNYRCLPGKQGGYTSGVFKTVLIANNISQLNKEANLGISREEITMCKKLAKNNDIFDLLAKSIAPSIHGHEYEKKAILCLLLGGIEKNLANGTRLRGDINVLLIGDPSVAKSQLLRYVLQTAPRAIPTTGRGSSGVGLTAAVTSDQETGERRLEAGAMVLADRGVVCIDEFDKMSDIDRTAIHEVMEQGKVTISKAGIHASLNARCSVLAAANPVYGRYDQYKTPMENIALQDSLLSRFDLLFVMLDIVDNDHDRMIADHVVRMHRYRKPGEQDGEVLPMGGNYADMLTTINARREEGKDAPIYEKYDALLHGNSRRADEKVLSVEFIRKYINIAKCLKPKLTEGACEVIANEYSRLRSQDMQETNVARTQPITARTLETLIRLATAHAKARMAKTVAVQDASAAIELVQYAYFKKVLEKEKKKRRRANSGSSSDENEVDMEQTTTNGSGGGRKKTTKRTRTEEAMEQDSDLDEDMPHMINQPDAGDLTQRATRRSIATATTASAADESARMEEGEAAATIDAAKLQVFKSCLQKAFRELRTQSLSVEKVKAYLEQNASEHEFTDGEIKAAVQRMTDDNQVMLADGIIILI